MEFSYNWLYSTVHVFIVSVHLFIRLAKTSKERVQLKSCDRITTDKNQYKE